MISRSTVTKQCLLSGSIKVPFFGFTNALIVIILIALLVIIWNPISKVVNQGEDINKTISELTDLQKITEDEPKKNYATRDIRI